MMSNDKVKPKGVDDTKVKEAIAAGEQAIKAGSTKTEASRAIFAKLPGEPQETVVQAFIKGANLTPRGALTYWYNRERERKKSLE
jgi:hypothetical protein